MIGYFGSKKIKVKRIKNDNQVRILMVDADINEETFVLINLYNVCVLNRNKLKLFVSSISY